MVQAKKGGTPIPKAGEAGASGGNVKWNRPSKPNFVKLRAGDRFDGIFLGMVKTQFGPGYRFRSHEGEIFTIGGNRAQIDQIFVELMGSPQGFVGDTIIGHALIVAREADTESKAGRRVAVYAVGHDLDRCPKGCK
jgi:hypothetical protein